MVKFPGFVKFYQPSLGQHNSKIPTMFIQSIQGNLPENVAFRDSSNNLWQVKVEMRGDYWYFKEGWTEFINDIKVEEGELLVYEYFSPGIFDFKVHDRSTCSTNGVGDLTRVQRVLTDGDHCIPCDVDESQRVDYFEAEEVTDTDDDEAIRDMDCICAAAAEEDDDDATTATNHKRTREVPSDNNPQRGKVRDCGASSSTKKGKRDWDWFGLELFESGLAQQPNNQYFVTKKRKNRAYELFVPAEVIKVYSLNLPEAIVLVDHKGRRFPASRKTWSDGRTFYCGGWTGICAVNFVGDEDACICEFVREAGSDLFIRVTFVPAQTEPTVAP